MLMKCKSALLLSSVESFTRMYTQLASEIGVRLVVEAEWNRLYRVNQDIIILSSKYLDKVNESYYANAVLMLKSSERPEDFIEKGIKRFIFDYQNANELRLALYKDITIAKSYTISRYAFGRYDFDFGEDSFKYEGRYIYLTPTEKAYIASWLLGGHKDNAKRGILCYARRRLGSDFLKDIDRFGRIKEDKDE